MFLLVRISEWELVVWNSNIIAKFVKQILSSLLMFIPWIKKLIYPEKKFRNDLILHIGKKYPVEFILNSSIPQCRIWLSIINLSQFLDAEVKGINVKSLSINADYSHLISTNKSKMLKEIVDRKSIKELFFEFEVSEKQIEIISNIKRFYNLGADLQVELFIESNLYSLKTSENLNNIPCKLSLSKYPIKEQ